MTKETKETLKQSSSENKTQGVSIAGVVGIGCGVIVLVVIIFIASAPLIRDFLETKESTGSSSFSSRSSAEEGTCSRCGQSMRSDIVIYQSNPPICMKCGEEILNNFLGDDF